MTASETIELDTNTARARSRVLQVFEFLRAYAERNTPSVYRLQEQPWHLRLSDLPEHPSVEVGVVQLASSEDGCGPADTDPDRPLMRIRRPSATTPPAPPGSIDDWLEKGWEEPGATLPKTVTKRDVGRDGEVVSEGFADDAERLAVYAIWSASWRAWADAELPVRRAIYHFERLFEIRARLQKEGERLELLLGNGRLSWKAKTLGVVDHPVLLQRVELQFDPIGPEIRIVDADRAAELYQPILAIGMDGLLQSDAAALRSDLEQRGYHPFEKLATPQFLTRLVRLLNAHGEYEGEWLGAPITAQPRISHDPVLVLRARRSGFPAAMERVIDEINGGAEIPTSLRRLVGVDTARTESLPDMPAESAWGEPSDVLLSKPANDEQIRIAQVLKRFDAVLVQGPPGTGKSHTIANLIGDLLAQGKRVLVTSHTNKALSVLRDKVETALQPLCVAVLDSDMQTRAQMEGSVRSILARLSDSSEPTLVAEEQRLRRTRSELLQKLTSCTEDLRSVRQGEFADILIGGERTAPADAARWLAAQDASSDWVPGPVETGAPLPLSIEVFRWLYATNAELTSVEEQQIVEGVPELDALLSLSEFETIAADLYASAEADSPRWYSTSATEDGLAALSDCVAEIRALSNDLSAKLDWQRTLVGAGHSSDPMNVLWEDLAARLDSVVAYWRETLPVLMEHEPEFGTALPADRALFIAREVLGHVENGGGLGFLAVVLKGDWKRFLGEARVQGSPPRKPEHFRALVLCLELEEHRRTLARSWRKLAEPIGLPAYEGLLAPKEKVLAPYAEQIRLCLSWWDTRWTNVERALSEVGFQWAEFRAHEAARLGSATPFEQDVEIVGARLQNTLAARLASAKRIRAQRLLNELRDVLAPFGGSAVVRFREAVERGDPVNYGRALAELRVLWEKREVTIRRRELLMKLGKVAPGWANMLRERTDVHGASELPAGVADAWRRRQFAQELDRRAGLDETALMARIERVRTDLRTTTVALIDCRAFLAQMRRVDLTSQQALQGWAQTQKKIGKGTGKRAPALQLEARRLLAQARDAVPVWIMPLSRVAESFDAAREPFDVVIVDEASQSDCLGLLAWYLGKSIVVVGDDQQVSPLAVGQKIADIEALIQQHLTDVPNAHLYDGKTSIYDMAGQCFGGTIALKEHFRCVPDIIEFSNALSYNGSMRPLRDGTRVPRPHVAEIVADRSVGTLGDSSKRNEAEARIIAALLKALIEHPRYDGSTFGAITLLGEEQAELILRLALELNGAVNLDSRKFTAGNSAQFQGDERNVMFLSMVASPTGQLLPISQLPATKQRYNVAASRAQDQLWLVHSLDPNRDLRQGDLRRRLIEHVRDPGAVERAFAKQAKHAESPFEKEVMRDLMNAGYDVTPQVWVGRYRIDMVISSGDNQVALECDGDRYHGFEHVADDLARQAVLERAGWRFVRIRSTRFFRDRKHTMADVFAGLERFGVRPISGAASSSPADEDGSPFRQAIVARTWEIMREAGWLDGSAVSEDVQSLQLMAGE